MKYALVRMPEGRVERLFSKLEDATDYIGSLIFTEICARQEAGFGNAVSNTYQVQEVEG